MTRAELQREVDAATREAAEAEAARVRSLDVFRRAAEAWRERVAEHNAACEVARTADARVAAAQAALDAAPLDPPPAPRVEAGAEEAPKKRGRR